MLREIGCWLPAQSTHLHALQPQRRGHRPPVRAAQCARLRAQQPTCQFGPRHRRSSTIHTLVRTATAPVPPIRCLASAQSAHLRAQQPTCQLGHVICVQAQSAHLRARQPHQSRQSVAWYQHNPRICAHSSAGSSPMMPAVMRYGPHTCTHDNSQRCFPQPLSRHASGGTRHSSPATPTRLVHEDALCFLARLEKLIFSLGAGDRYGRDLQAD